MRMYTMKQIQVGDTVKITMRGERFWNIVTAIKGDRITATVENILSNGLRYGEIIHFNRNQIEVIWVGSGPDQSKSAKKLRKALAKVLQ